jgi:hypothetical protein
MELYLPYVTFALALASLILHFVAPKTKTLADDKALEAIDKAKDFLGGK